LEKYIIEARNIYKNFIKDSVEIKVLKNVNLKIKKGDKVAITGKSGSGKSTLLNLLGTLDYPTKGEILINDVNTTILPEDTLAELRNSKIGFVFQFHYLIKELTALENAILPALIGNKNIDIAKEKAIKLFEELDIIDRMNHKPNELSGGEQQRVAVARALINEPEILIADEPTGNLDTKNTEKLLNLIDEFHKKYNLTLILATHNNEVAKICNRIVRLEDGEVKEVN